MQLLNHLKTLEPELLETIETLVQYESPSTDKEHCDRLVRHLAGVWSELGLKTEIIEEEETGDHLRVVYEPEGEAQGQLLVLSHVDTVWPVGTTAERPFRVEGDRAFGPGIFDMKTGAAQTIYALRALLELGQAPAKRIVLLYNTDEEIGSPTSRGLIEEEAKRSDAVLVLEPSVPPQGALKTFRKGVGMYTLKITGKASHAGADPELGVSAVTELAHQIIHLNSLADEEQGTTVNVGVVEGGTRRNVIAASARAGIDVRITSLAEAERIHRDLMAVESVLAGTTLEMTGEINRPPMLRTERTVALFEQARHLAAELGFDLQETSSGGGSDGNFTAALGVPTVDGLGAVGEGGHAEHEHILIDHLVPRTALLARLLETL